MSQIITVKNSLPEEDWVPITKLSFDEASGQAVIRWDNPSGFTASWAVQIGETGGEQTEIKLLGTATVAGTAGTLTANLDFNHAADTPIYGIKYDQVVFGVSTTGTNSAGTVGVITGGTVNIGADADNTFLDYSAGATTDAYKVQFLNSVTAGTTSWSDWILPGGLAFYTLGKMRDRIKAKLFDFSYIKSDDTINDWVNEWMEKMTNAAIDINEDYAIGTMDMSYSGTAEYATITNAYFKQTRRVWYTENGVDWYNATKFEQTDFEPNQQFNNTTPYYFMVGDNIIGRRPNENAGTFRVWFYSLGTIMSNDSDELPLSMRSYTESFVNYGLAQAFLKDGKIQEFQDQMSLANNSLGMFKKELTPRNKTSQTMIKFVEYLSPEDYDPVL